MKIKKQTINDDDNMEGKPTKEWERAGRNGMQESKLRKAIQNETNAHQFLTFSCKPSIVALTIAALIYIIMPSFW